MSRENYIARSRLSTLLGGLRTAYFILRFPFATLDAYIRAGFRESVGFRFQKKEKIPNLSGPGSIGIGKFVRKSVAVVREDLNLYVVRA